MCTHLADYLYSTSTYGEMGKFFQSMSNLDYISALTNDEIRSLLKEGIVQLSLFSEKLVEIENFLCQTLTKRLVELKMIHSRKDYLN